jgi:Uma2 family endonuclease
MTTRMPEALDILGGRPLPAEPMTYEEFLEWLDEDTHAEWVDGRVVPMSPIAGLHDVLVRFLGSLMKHLLEAFPLGEIRGDPFQMKTGPDLPGRAPDLIFIFRSQVLAGWWINVGWLWAPHPKLLDVLREWGLI